MLTARILNSEATLNDFFPLSSQTYVPGENVTVVIQLMQAQRGIRYVPPAGAVTTITLKNADETDFSVTASLVDASDRSMLRFVLTQAQSLALGSSNILIEVDLAGDGVTVYLAVIGNALIRTSITGDC